MSGKVPGSGRAKGSTQKVSRMARAAAAASGLLPHEWLLAVSRGEPIPHKRWEIKRDKNGKEISRTLVEEILYADFPTRVDAAKAAAPFYAPKLATQTISVNDSATVAEALKQIAEALPV